MATSPDNLSMALFCDFENVALGVRDLGHEKFDIKPVLERLLLKGSIVVKKAYCDWDRYKAFKATMHEANFELIEIPHVRQSGKNSADIRLVVDALDLCYTKAHVNTFVIISGDSDFSPLVSKLRENAKQVIGVGVRQSTSDLLVANCDEFIFYDDLVRESQRAQVRRERPEVQAATRRTPDEERKRKDELEVRRRAGIDLAVQTFDALVAERGDGKIWASVLKEAIKRRKPDFSESGYGFRAFGNLLEEAQVRGLLAFGRAAKCSAVPPRPRTWTTSKMPRPQARPARLRRGWQTAPNGANRAGADAAAEVAAGQARSQAQILQKARRRQRLPNSLKPSSPNRWRPPSPMMRPGSRPPPNPRPPKHHARRRRAVGQRANRPHLAIRRTDKTTATSRPGHNMCRSSRSTRMAPTTPK